MIGFIANLFARPQPGISAATPADAADMAALHGASFHRGWSEDEFERLLIDRTVVAHRVTIGRRLVGFIISRIITGEAEILSVVAQGDTVVLFAEERGKVRTNGSPYLLRWVQLFTFRESKIARLRGVFAHLTPREA